MTGSARGLVSPRSVYCDWVWKKVWSATFISVRQHVQLSEQICPWDILASCWDIEQPTNKKTSVTKVGDTGSYPCFPQSSRAIDFTAGTLGLIFQAPALLGYPVGALLGYSYGCPSRVLRWLSFQGTVMDALPGYSVAVLLGYSVDALLGYSGCPSRVLWWLPF